MPSILDKLSNPTVQNMMFGIASGLLQGRPSYIGNTPVPTQPHPFLGAAQAGQFATSPQNLLAREQLKRAKEERKQTEEMAKALEALAKSPTSAGGSTITPEERAKITLGGEKGLGLLLPEPFDPKDPVVRQQFELQQLRMERGENDPLVRKIEDEIAKEGRSKTFTQRDNILDDHLKSKGHQLFTGVQEAFDSLLRNLPEAGTNPGAAFAAINQVLEILDPESVKRESEVAAVGAIGGLRDSLGRLVREALAGGGRFRISEKAQADIESAMTKVYEAALRTETRREQQTQQRFKNEGFDPDREFQSRIDPDLAAAVEADIRVPTGGLKVPIESRTMEDVLDRIRELEEKR